MMNQAGKTRNLALKGRIAALLIAFALSFCMPLPAFAASAFDNPSGAPGSSGSSAAVSSSTEKSAGNLFAVMHPVSNTDIENDLYWVGQKFDANKVNVGTSGHGSILAAGQSIALNDVTVADSVRAAAQDISIAHAKIANNITIAARDISLGNEVSANGIYAAAESLSVGGTYKGGSLTGENVTFSGVVEGDLNISATNINIEKNAQVTGTLALPEGVEVTIAEGAQVPNIAYASHIQVAQPGPFDNLITILYACMAHIVLVGLFFVIIRKSLVRAANMAREQLVKMLLAGLVIFIVAPLVCLLLIFPLITIPVVVLMVLVMIIIALFSLPFAGSALGLTLLGKRMNPVLAAVIGTVVLTILAYIPFVSTITVIFCIIFTAGYLWMCYWEMHKQRKQERYAAREAAFAAQQSALGANANGQPGPYIPPAPPASGDATTPPVSPTPGGSTSPSAPSTPKPDKSPQPPAPTGEPVDPAGVPAPSEDPTAGPASDPTAPPKEDEPRS